MQAKIHAGSQSVREIAHSVWSAISIDDCVAGLHTGCIWFVKVWFRHYYPASFISASLTRLGSVASTYYAILAVGLVIASSVKDSTEPASWWKTHKVIDTMSIALLLVSFTWALFCRSAAPEVVDFFDAVGFGVDIRDDRECGFFFSILPELMLCIVGLINWIFRLCVDQQIFNVASDRKNMRLRDYVFVGVLLIVCASLHCNVFSAAYHMSILATLVFFCGMSPRARLRVVVLRKLSQFLLCVGGSHILTFLVVRGLSSSLPKWAAIFLGGADVIECSTQCLLSFVSVGLLLRSAPHLALSGDVDLEKPCHGEAKHETDETYVDTHALRDTSGQTVVQRHPVTRLILRAASPRDGTESESSEMSQNTLGAWFAVAALAVFNIWGSSGILMILSLMIWSISWPSLAALPFLAMSLIMLQFSVHRIPRWMLYGVLLYQGAGSLLLYNYNVYLMATEAFPSKVPDSYTWAERCCLQNFVSEGEAFSMPIYRRTICILAQAFATMLFALNVLFLHHYVPLSNATSQGKRDVIQSHLKLLLQFCSWISRFATVLVILVYVKHDNFSLITIGYILWLLCLTVSGVLVPTGGDHEGTTESESSDGVGWDALHGHPWVWHALLLYTRIIIVLRYTWVVLVDVGSDVVGTTRGYGSISRTTADLLIAVLACVQTRGFQANIGQPKFLTSQDSLLARAFSNFGIFWQLAVLFFIVMSPPVSVDSFLFLIIFNTIVSIEHFIPSHWVRNWLLLVCAFMSALVVLARSIVMLPSLEAELLPLIDSRIAKILGLEISEDVRAKIVAIFVVLMTSCALRRVSLFSASARSRANEGSSFGLSPERVRRLFVFLDTAARWSHRALLIAAFFLMRGRGALPTIQLLLLMVILVSGQFWDSVGALVSIYCVTLLCLQYLHRFDFKDGVHWLSKENGIYWGLSWSPELVSAEVALLLLAIVQSTVQREAKRAQAYCWYIDDQSQSTVGPKLRVELVGYGPQVAVCLLILIAVLGTTVWSLLTMLLIFSFVVSGASRERLTADRSKFWLSVFSAFLITALIFGWALELWLPPGSPKKPSDERISQWRICGMFDNSSYIDEVGVLCVDPSSHVGYCTTQQMHCAKAWRLWIGDEKSSGHAACEFLLLFVISIIRNMCKKPVDAVEGSISSECTAPVKQDADITSNASATKVILDLDELPESPIQQSPIVHLDDLCEREYRPQAGGSAMITCEQGPVDRRLRDNDHPFEHSIAASKGNLRYTMSHLSHLSSLKMAIPGLSASKFKWGRPYHWYRGCEIMFWISLASAFMSQREVDVISVCYMLFLLFHLHRELSHIASNPYLSRMLTLRHIRLYNLMVFITMCLYQCPLLPCAYQLDSLKGTPVPNAYFSSPQQCSNAYTNHVDAWAAATNREWRVLGLFLRSIGLKKRASSDGMGSDSFWNLMVFGFGLAQSLVLSRWHDELKDEFESYYLKLEWYEENYRKFLGKWQCVELNRSLNKRRALLTKLHRLIDYLNQLRMLWMDQRAAFTRKEEYDRNREVRILDLSLEAGVKESLVEKILNEFEAPFYQHLEQDGIRSPLDEHTHKLVDQCVLQQVALEEKRIMDYISRIDEEAQKARTMILLETVASKLREQGAKNVEEILSGPDAEVQRTRSTELLQSGAAKLRDSPVEKGEGIPAEKLPRTDGSRGGEATAQNRIIDVDTCQRLASETKVIADKVCQELETEWKEGDEHVEQVQLLEGFDPYYEKALVYYDEIVYVVKEHIGYYIDDLLWYEHGHECLWTHREGNSLWNFFVKLAWSQTLAFLIFACMLQFAVYQSVAALVNIMSTLFSLMIFPHPSRWFWRSLQTYNIVLITFKMLYQLPLFCGDGEHFFSVSECDTSTLPASVPGEMVLGFLKIRSQSSRKDTYSFTSVFEAFWADMLVCALLFIHWDRLANGGRLGNPQELCKDIELKLKVNSAKAPADSLQKTTPRSSISSVQNERHSFIHEEDSARLPEVPGERTSMIEEMPELEAVDERSLQPHAQPVSNRLKNCPIVARELLHYIMHLLVDSARLPKPVCNLYSARLLCSLACFMITLVFWQNLTGTGQSIYDSISNNEFSISHAVCVVLFLALMIIDRVLYTSYMQKDFSSEQSGSTIAAEEAKPINDQIVDIMPATRSAPALIQKLILLAQVIALHVLCIWNWEKAEITEIRLSMFSNPTLAAFYFLYIAYLALTALQQQYDISVTKGGLGFTHSTDTVTWLMFKGYQVVPFLEEVRVLSDWTATRTSLNFMMWMKLEDANQALYETQVDMDYRRTFAKGQLRPLCEKFFQGGLFLIALFALIVGPLLWFSPLVSGGGVATSVVAGTFNVKLLSDITTLTIYESGGGVIQDLGPEEMSMASREFTELPSADSARLQSLTFPVSSASAWFPTLRQQLIQRLAEPAATMSLVFSLSLRLDGSTVGSWRDVHRTVTLQPDQLQQLTWVLSASSSNSSVGNDIMIDASLRIPNAWPSLVYVSSDTNREDEKLGAHIPAALTFKPQVTMPYWSLTNSVPGCETPSNTTDCRFAVKVVSSKRTAVSGISGASTVIGLYLGIIYTIGRFLRLVFQGKSKKVIYEELQDTALLQDLCNGIYICRIHGLLKTEFDLYYELLHIYRNPMLLLEVSKAAGSWQRNEADIDIEGLSARGLNRTRRALADQALASDSSRSVAPASHFFSRTVTKFLAHRSSRSMEPDANSKHPPPTDRPIKRQQVALESKVSRSHVKAPDPSSEQAPRTDGPRERQQFVLGSRGSRTVRV